MQFWIRHAILLVLCVALPFIAALYVDTTSEIRRAEKEGKLGAKFAAANLESRLTLDAHKNVNNAISIAQRIQDRDLVGELANKPNATPAAQKRRGEAYAAAVEILKTGAPEGGFAWLIDETGAILARADGAAPEDAPRMIGAHPLFVETQQGFALDGLWKEDRSLAMVGAAPVIVKSQPLGAVFIGAPFSRGTVEALSNALNCKVTLIVEGQVLATTLDTETAQETAAAFSKPRLAESDMATNLVSTGALREPLAHPYLPMLPLFIDKDAKGFAFTSMSARVPGTDDVSWVVSSASGEQLRGLPERQELVLGGLGAFFMLALLIGMVNHRTFVGPIDKITEHLSELTQGRGEMELPEGRVSAPFRRLVKLINMTVQRIPSRGFSTTRSSASGESPISEIGGVPSIASSTVTQMPQSRAALERLGIPVNQQPPIERQSSSSSSSSSANDGSSAIDGLLPPAPPPTQPPQRAPNPASSESRLNIPRQQSVLEKHPFEGGGDVLADAVSSLARSQSGTRKPPASPELEEADAIAQAIASLESGKSGQGAQPSSPPAPGPRSGMATIPPATTQTRQAGGGLEAPKQPSLASSKTGIRSAADIRGKPSESIMGAPSPFMPSQSELFRGGPPGPRTDAAMDERTPIEAQMQAVARAQSTSTRSGGSLNLASYAGIGASAPVETEGFNPEATVVAPVADELLRKSASREDTTDHHAIVPQQQSQGDMTMVASVPPNLLAQTMGDGDDDGGGGDLAGLDAADHAHFKETYERFIEMRKRCGEATGDLAFDRFLAKLAKNREGLIKKYNCRTVRFQVYEKDGKAALKATPVRAR